MKDVLKGCPGFINVADDIIMRDKDAGVSHHEDNVGNMLQKLNDKCVFRQPRLKSFRHTLGSNRISPSEEKVVCGNQQCMLTKRRREGQFLSRNSAELLEVYPR